MSTDPTTPTTRSNSAWHRGYDEGAASADQEFAVCAPPEQYDSEAATEFMAGFWTGLKHGRGALQ